jgi:hypothetical protein
MHDSTIVVLNDLMVEADTAKKKKGRTLNSIVKKNS